MCPMLSVMTQEKGDETSVKNHYFDADTLNARIKYYILWFKIISKNLKLTTTPTEQKYLVL